MSYRDIETYVKFTTMELHSEARERLCALSLTMSSLSNSADLGLAS